MNKKFKPSQNKLYEYENLSEREKIRRQQEVIDLLFNELEKHLQEEYQDKNILELFQRGDLIIIRNDDI